MNFYLRPYDKQSLNRVMGVKMREYMQMFIWIMLFVIVIEMIFPDSDYKKYLKLVLGCIIIYTIMKPIVQFIPVQGQTYDHYVSDYQKKLSEGLGYQNTLENYDEQIKSQQDTLKETFSENIKKVIEKECDIGVKRVDMEWHEGTYEVELAKIDLVVGVYEKEGGNINRIPQIKIGNKSSSISADEENLKIKIKTCLQNFYNVPSCNIHITVQKN